MPGHGRALRGRPNARLVVDANCAWTVEQALRLIPALAELGVEWVEQPWPKTTWRASATSTSARPAHLADEPIRTARTSRAWPGACTA